MSEDRRLVELQRGQRARQILEDPVFQEAVAHAKGRMHRAWEDSPSTAAEAREDAYRQVKALDLVLQSLRTFANEGTVSERKLAGARGGER